MAGELPPSLQAGMAALDQLTTEQYEAIAHTWSSAAVSVKELTVRTAESAQLERADARALVVTLASIRQAYPSLDEIDGAVARPLNYNVELSEGTKDRLRQLLISKAITLITRSTRLQLDNERNFQSAFIATSARPVFHNRVEDAWLDESAEDLGLYGAVVVNQLKIEFYQDSVYKAMHFSLDLDDLRALADAVERGIKKHEALLAQIGSRGLAMDPLGGE